MSFTNSRGGKDKYPFEGMEDPIHEFTLYIQEIDDSSKVGLDKTILHLSRNHTVKKFKLEFEADSSPYDLPSSIFSLHHLTELYLGWCRLDHQPTFDGFGSLTVLTLDFVMISRNTLLHLLYNCPSLKSFTLLMLEEQILGDEQSDMIELFECLPLIERLTVWSEISSWFVPDLVPQELPTSLIHLKYFRFTQMSFHDGYRLTFLAVLIKSSPKLEKIELEIDTNCICDPEEYDEYHSDVWLAHLSDVWLEHLSHLKLEYFSNLEPELEFVKFILARSPKLKK
ncbi:hypothetical protein M8C21_016685, partial [Ambrosia artemisiifolia]